MSFRRLEQNWSTLLDFRDVGGHRYDGMWMPVRIGEEKVLCMLDTGAPCCVFRRDLLPDDAEPCHTTSLSTRVGTLDGRIYRAPITLLAEPPEADCELEVTAFIPDRHPPALPDFVGRVAFHQLLMAIDITQQEGRLHFVIPCP